MIRINRDYLILLSAHFFFFLNFSELILLPKYLLFLGLSPAEIGIIMGSFSVAVVIALPVVGLISETISRRWLFMFGSVLMALPTIFYPEIKGVTAWLFILRILQGIGFSCAFGVAGAIVSDNTHESDDTYLLGILTVVGLLTQAIGPSFGEYLINTSGYRPLFQTATLFGLISLGLAFFLPSSESAGWRRIKKVHLISRSFFSTAILGIIFGSMVIFLPPYLMTQGVNNSSPFFIGFVFGGFLVWTVLYRVLKILNNHLVWIVMSLLLVLLLSFIRTAGSPAVLSVLALLCGIGYGYLYPTLNARMIEMNPSFKGIANSLFVWSFNIGMLLASVGFGFMCEYAGYETAFQATALVGFILMASTGFIGYKKLY